MKVLLPIAAILTLAAFSNAAQASDRCTTKPAVCARLKAQKAPVTADKKGALSVGLAERCTTKPAICARDKAKASRINAAQVSVGPEVTSKAPSRCISKPMVCARQDALKRQ